MLTRRTFLAGTTTLAAGALGLPVRGAQPAGKKVAFLGTEVRLHSHAQHFLDRMTLGYAWGGGWQRPRVEVASVFIDQFPEGDLARGRVKRHGLKLYPTIAEALTLGGEKLAVDGVVIIAEHGDYPQNEKGQRLYPRYEWFKEVVKVFEASGRSVPVFNDKHLSTTWPRCQEMVEDSRRLGFAFLAGSSLPVTWRLPSVDVPHGAPLVESVCVCYGGVDSYDFHGLETAQCMSERRAGGEVGISSVHALGGEPMWRLLASPERETTRRLFTAALRRSHTLPVKEGYVEDVVSVEWARRLLPDTLGYFIEHRDGFRTAMFLTSIQDFNYAGLRRDTNEIISCQMYLPMPTHSATTADFFNPLIRHLETLVLDNRAAYPVERTLLTSGMTLAAVDSIHRGHALVETPEMKVAYRGPEESTFWQA
ncbi:MAG TPA: hypothetical protein VJ828_09485 [Lacipirellulaceae bacterium]|nr:hypothetical protein [Lacipirellulaceae bacterium]